MCRAEHSTSGCLPLLCVTDRKSSARPFLEQLQRVLAVRPAGILLREKDLSAADYRALAHQVADLCEPAGIPLVVHTHAEVARELKCRHLHLTLPMLEALPASERARLAASFELSTSCHSMDDARRAAELGCVRVIAGHVYETPSKPGLQPRGLGFLRKVCEAIPLPVWAIGGVTPNRLPELQASGAAGACMLGHFMRL